MFKWSSILFLVCKILLVMGSSKKDWTYTMHSFSFNCTDENVISAPLRTLRVSPGVYGLNGTIKIGHPIDGDYKVSIRILRSPSGTSQYQITPFGIPKIPFPTFMKTFYKNFAMDDVKTCSNMPVFEHYIGPLPVGEYHVNSCIVSTRAMPNHMAEGFYKIIYEVEGPLAHFTSDLISQVHRKL